MQGVMVPKQMVRTWLEHLWCDFGVGVIYTGDAGDVSPITFWNGQWSPTVNYMLQVVSYNQCLDKLRWKHDGRSVRIVLHHVFKCFYFVIFLLCCDWLICTGALYSRCDIGIVWLTRCCSCGSDACGLWSVPCTQYCFIFHIVDSRVAYDMPFWCATMQLFSRHNHLFWPHTNPALHYLKLHV